MQDAPNISSEHPVAPGTSGSGHCEDRKSRRQRTRVDYRALNDMMFGTGGCTLKDEEDEDEDDEYVPAKQRSMGRCK